MINGKELLCFDCWKEWCEYFDAEKASRTKEIIHKRLWYKAWNGFIKGEPIKTPEKVIFT